jgi:hypothetical protein
MSLGLAVPAVPNLLFYVDRKTVSASAPRAGADTLVAFAGKLDAAARHLALERHGARSGNPIVKRRAHDAPATA